MKRTLGMALLLVGVSMAGAFGARNGQTHVEYRVDLWEVAQGAEPTVTLPEPGQRLMEWGQRSGLGFMVGVVLIAFGAGLARQHEAEMNAGGGATDASGRVDFPGALAAIQPKLASIQQQLEGLPMDETAPEARTLLDTIQAELIEPVVDGRGQLVARHGVGSFAEYFGPFSAGERLLNRCWSALTDGHPPTARAALSRAIQQFDAAMVAWNRVESQG